MKPGAQKILIVRTGLGPDEAVIEKPMVLRRTLTDHAYVFQTPEDSFHRPFQGLHLDHSLQMRHDMALIPFAPTHPQYKEANQQFRDLSDSLGVPRGGVGY
ncbi:MAG TPA: hypothetical protein VMR43_00690 [Variovorax sp.]|nr:hypothetical protein [Variovorax sp.]